MLDLNEFSKEVHENAVAHGWWDETRQFPEVVAMCHSELSEALEEYRNGRPIKWYACLEGESEHPCTPKDLVDCLQFGEEETCPYRSKKPDGIGVELGDCIIRILDWCGANDIDIEGIIKEKHEYNKLRSYRHGGKIV